MAERRGFYVSQGLLTAEHRRRIGPAIWEFEWLVAHETREGGRVLNGSPITIERVADELGEGHRTARRNLARLVAQGYVSRIREHGAEYQYQIANSKKWIGAAINVPSAEAKSGHTPGQKWPHPRPEVAAPPAINGQSNKEVDSKTVRHRSKTFVAPTVEEVSAYCTKRGNGIDPEYWIDYYIRNGWMVGKVPMKDWQATIRTWEKNEKKRGSNGTRANYAEQRQESNLKALEEAKRQMRLDRGTVDGSS